jgi:hypothetical protein
VPDEALVPLDAALPDVVAELVVVVAVVAGVVVVAAVVAGVMVVPEALVPPEVVEPDPVEPVELAVVAELVLPEVLAPEPVELDVVPALFLAVALVVDPELAPTRATEATAVVVVAVRRERAGSLPETSCRKITDQSARNSASAVATTRLRITETRRSRARRRCATSRLASGCALERVGAGSVSDGGTGVEASRGVIVTSLRSGRDAMTTQWRRCLAAP